MQETLCQKRQLSYAGALHQLLTKSWDVIKGLYQTLFIDTELPLRWNGTAELSICQ